MVVACAMAGSAPAVAQTNTWNTNASSTWSNAGNWSAGTPVSGQALVLTTTTPNTTAYDLTTNGNVTLSSVTITGNHGFTINRASAGNSIQLQNGGSITFNNTGAGVALNTGIVINGSATLTMEAGVTSVSLGTNTITGTGSLTLVNNDPLGGNNNFQLSTVNTYTGSTTVGGNGDNVVFGVAGALPSGSALTINAGARAQFNDANTAGSLSGAGQLVVGAGTVVLTVGSDNTSTTFSGAISGNGSLVKTGTGTLTLSGTSTYQGGTTVSGGALQVSADANLGNAAGGLTLGSGGMLRYGAGFASARTVTLNAGGGVFDTNGVDATLSGTVGGAGGLTKTGAGTLTLSGTVTYSGGTTVSAGTLQGTTATLLGDVTNNAAVVFSQAGNGTYAGTMSGTGSLTVMGGGTVTLSGANSYTGGTTVSAGTLQGTTSSVQGNIVNNAAVVFNQATDGTYAGTMSGTGSVTLTGGGTITLSGTNTYTGGTTLNAGMLRGTTASLTGNIINNAAVVFDQSSTGTYSGVISGTGSLTKSGTGTVVLTGVNTYSGTTTVDAGTLQVGDAASPTARLGTGSVTVNAAGTLSGHGAIGGALINNGRVSPGGSVGTLTVAGNYTQGAGAALAIEVQPSAASRLAVTGTAALAGTLALTVIPGTYTPGTTYQVLTAGGGVTGTFGQVTGAQISPLLGLAARYLPGVVELTVAGATTASGVPVTIASIGDTGNRQAIGGALDIASAVGATGALGRAILALMVLPTQSAIGAAIDSIGGGAEGYADLPAVGVRHGHAVGGALIEQMHMRRGGAAGGTAVAESLSGTRVQLASLDPIAALAQAPAPSAAMTTAPSPWSAWLTGYGVFGAIGSNGNAHTATYSTGGTAFGADYRLEPDLLLGLFAGYGGSGIGVRGLSGNGSVDSHAFGVYGSATGRAGYVDAMLGYGYDDHRLTHTIAFPGFPTTRTRGSTRAHQFLSALETGHPITLRADTAVTPFAGVQAVVLDQAAFTETGAGTLDLAVRSQDVASVRSQLGVRLAHTLDLGRPMTVSARVGWAHELADTGSTTRARFATTPGTDFAVEGAQRRRDSALVGVGIAGRLDAATTTLHLRYDGDINGRDDAHAVTAGIRLTW